MVPVLVERRCDATAGLPAHRDEPDLLDVGEEGDAQLTFTGDPLALSELQQAARLHGKPA